MSQATELIAKQMAAGASIGRIWGNLIYNVKDTAYGAKGDGVANDSSAIQSAIDAAYSAGGGAVFLPPSTAASVLTSYLVGTTIKMKPNVYLFAYPGTVVLKASSSLPFDKPLLQNNTITGSVDTYYDANMTVEGITFDGNNNAGRTAELVSFAKAKNVSINRCAVQNVGYMGIGLAGNQNVMVQNCYFTNTGNPVVTPEGGASVWVDNHGDGSKNMDITIDNCYFYQLNWSGAYFMPLGGTISNCVFRNCMESSIFSNSGGSRISYLNNKIYYSTKKNISACGIETGASLITIIGNHIEGCGDSGIAMTDVQQAVIDSNVIINNGADPAFTAASGIALLSYSAAPNQPDHIKISNNRIYDQQGIKTQVYGINVAMTNANTPITTLVINDNDLGTNKTKNINYQAGVLGAGCSMRGNSGDASNTPHAGAFQGPAANGNMSVTGIGFIPRYIELVAVDASGTRALQSTAFVTVAMTVDGSISSSAGVSSGTPDTKAVDIRDQTGTILCQSSLVSFDQDGFTLNFTTTTLRPWISYVAHP